MLPTLHFSPWDLKSTTFDASQQATESAAAVLNGAYIRAGQIPPIAYPAGGALTTVRDLARFSLTQMSGASTVSLLKPATVALMQTIHADAYCQQPRHYGLGLDIELYRGKRLVTHDGIGLVSAWPYSKRAA